MTDVVVKPETAPDKSSRKRWPISWWVLLAFSLLILLFFPFGHETWFKCAACSMSHSELRIVGILTSCSEEETECSKWYRANVESQHEHVWVRGPMGYGKSIYGYIFYGSDIYSPDGYRMPMFMTQIGSRVSGPLFFLGGDSSKLEMYKASPDPVLTRDLFLKLSSFKPPDTAEYKQQMEIFERLENWGNSGYKAPWPFETQ